jgi:hypothetical protein
MTEIDLEDLECVYVSVSREAVPVGDRFGVGTGHPAICIADTRPHGFHLSDFDR